MSNEILYILLPDFAEHEMVYLAEAIASDEFSLKENPKYINKFVASTLDMGAPSGRQMSDLTPLLVAASATP